MEIINWGIIGCGDVTEKKSGPAFNKVGNSRLLAVMRRDAVKASDYASRHQVPKWFTDPAQLINDPAINAIYIATPPSSHEQYTIQSIAAGKHVYVEKPMAMNAVSAQKMTNAANKENVKLVVAHYRREQPLFKKIKQLIDSNYIGEIKFVKLQYYKKAFSQEEMGVPKNIWRLDSSISGGGLFHDIAPHQLDLMIYFFGGIQNANGLSVNKKNPNADDVVAGNILFENGIVFNGVWCFCVDPNKEIDLCEIIGSDGSIIFPVFEHKMIKVSKKNKTYSFIFNPLEHVQEPMIKATVNYFLGRGPNPGSGENGIEVMRLLDIFSGK